jgi:hypothetical protein
MLWCFERQEKHMSKLKYLVLKTLYDWTSTSHAYSALDFLEFLDTLSFI